MTARLRSWSTQVFRDQLPLITVLSVILLAAILVASDRWRRGAIVLGIATLIAALLRLCLPSSRAGLLAVRSKSFDVGALGVTGALIVFLAWTINTFGTG